MVLIEPLWFAAESFDVFHANGVLHHTPHAREILAEAVKLLRLGGEMRLMLYTNHLVKVATGQTPEEIDHARPSEQAALWATYTRFCDAVGNYADWYDAPKLERLIAGLPLELVAWDYLRPDNGYAVAILKRPD